MLVYVVVPIIGINLFCNDSASARATVASIRSHSPTHPASHLSASSRMSGYTAVISGGPRGAVMGGCGALRRGCVDVPHAIGGESHAHHSGILVPIK